jgi:hypothetical protein
MSRYPEFTVKKDARELQVFLASVKNVVEGKVNLKKGADGDFVMHGNGQSLSNFQLKGDIKTECEWEADEGNWENVFDFLSSGVFNIKSVKSR